MIVACLLTIMISTSTTLLLGPSLLLEEVGPKIQRLIRSKSIILYFIVVNVSITKDACVIVGSTKYHQ